MRQAIRGWSLHRVTAIVLLCAALVLPWNLYFGVGIPDSRKAVFVVLAGVTLLSLASIITTHLGRRRLRPALADGLRLGLNVPYLLVVAGFVVFDGIQTVRHGGSALVPGGAGPGSWLGVAGALLAAQPSAADAGPGERPPSGWLSSARILGAASIAGAGLSVLFNLYWRIRYTVTSPVGSGAGGLGREHVAIIATAVVYAAVAWVTVVVASRWLLQHGNPSRLATIALGMATLTAGMLVWSLPIGRDIDEFHGIAQNTATAGVGFEGYLAWAAAAAIFVAPTLRVPWADTGAWLVAMRKVLSLTAVWCFGSALLRVTDLVVAVVLQLRYSPYDSAAMISFDVVTAVVAVWLRVNVVNRSLPAGAVWSMCAVLLGFAAARIVVGVGLAPRLAVSQRSSALSNPVYGNDLAQQITSTFDVLLCALAVGVLLVAVVAVPRYRAPVAPPKPRIFRPEAEARRLPNAPKIFRSTGVSDRPGRHET